MPDQRVDWRELTRMPMFVDVRSCSHCPLDHDDCCTHPSKGHTYDDTSKSKPGAPPDWCPLRSGSLTIQLKT